MSRFRATLGTHLETRRTEIEQAILTRVYAISDPAEVHDPAYLDGLRSAISAGFDHAIAALQSPDGSAPSAPPGLLAQARLAARSGVGLDIVLRRYAASHSLLSDILIEEVEKRRLAPHDLRHLLRRLSTSLDRLLAAVSAEFLREAEAPSLRGAAQRRLELVRGLLAGELLDASELGYELNAHHLALLAAGPGVEEALGHVTAGLDRRMLRVEPKEGTLWAWLGGRRALEGDRLGELAASLAREAPTGCTFALGEPAQGLEGWRLSHRQAAAALPIALRRGDALARYRDVALLASALQDDLLTASLRRLYLEPLERARGDGEILRETLHAYFAADYNVSSAAASLEVDRHTITSRLRRVEEAVGVPLPHCVGDLQVALMCNELRFVDTQNPGLS